MPQGQLPLLPAGTTRLNDDLAFECHDGQVTYFNGHLPVFTHAQDDLAAFRLFTSTAAPPRATFAALLACLKWPCSARWTSIGPAVLPRSLYRPNRNPGRKLTPEVLSQVQARLDQGELVPEISRQTGVLANTIHKAIRAGRLRGAAKKEPGVHPLIRTQSQRRAQAQAAPLSCAITRTEERLLAAVGVLRQASVEFEAAADVPLGGVLWALPALLAKGLLRYSRKHFALPEGFYPLETIFLVLAFMALVRVRSLEALRCEPPGEGGHPIC